MAGTSLDVTFAILFMPPIITSPNNTASMPPVKMCLIPKVENMEFEILFIWGILPVPKEENIVATAKKAPIIAPVLSSFPLRSLIFSLSFI